MKVLLVYPQWHFRKYFDAYCSRIYSQNDTDQSVKFQISYILISLMSVLVTGLLTCRI